VEERLVRMDGRGICFFVIILYSAACGHDIHFPHSLPLLETNKGNKQSRDPRLSPRMDKVWLRCCWVESPKQITLNPASISQHSVTINEDTMKYLNSLVICHMSQCFTRKG